MEVNVEPIKEGSWTVKDIDTHYHSLGIPHFQRGLVWGSEATSLLLESIFFDTPCGAIILWEPEDPTREGQPLPGSSAMKYLIVDGQQRVRSLHGVLAAAAAASESHGGEEEEAEDADASEAADARIWCVNLCRVPGLDSFFDGDQSQYPLFRFVVDPNEKSARFKKNLIPVCAFLEGRTQGYDQGIEPRKGYSTESVKSELREMVEVHLANRVSEMKTREVFTVKVLREDAKSRRYHLPEVVMLYNRINSAGKRVESEEKAFATLVSNCSDTSKWLREVFESIHEKGQDENAQKDKPAKMARDEALQRKKERNFGFKLFIRTFIQVCSYRFDYSIGSNTFSFEVLNNPLLQQQLKTDPDATHSLFEKTKDLLRYVRRDLLLDRLKCDDLQMLPDTASLLPIFQLLIRFPRLMDKTHAGPLQGLALRLFLSSGQSQDAILDLVKAVNGAVTANAALRILDEKVVSAEALRKVLPKRLKDSNSLQDRYTLMLYWLLRNRGAKDFSYEANLKPDERAKMGRECEPEALIEERVHPEKQHLVPYSHLKQLYRIPHRGRVSRHVANNIGNITYISRAFNSFTTGIGSRPVKLEREPKYNTEAHFLDAPKVQRQYELALKAPRGDAGDARKRAQGKFERLCDLRRRQIAQAFADWVGELAPLIGIPDRIVPEARFNLKLEDRIRQLGYHADIEDALLDGVASGRFGLQKKRGRDPKDRLVLELCDGPKKRGCEIWIEPLAIHLKEKGDSELCVHLRETMVSCGFREDGTDWTLETEKESVARIKDILEKLHRTA